MPWNGPNLSNPHVQVGHTTYKKPNHSKEVSIITAVWVGQYENIWRGKYLTLPAAIKKNFFEKVIIE